MDILTALKNESGITECHLEVPNYRCHTQNMPAIRITVDRQPAVTIDMAAAAHGLSHHAMRHALDRAGAEPIPGALIGRQPLYSAKTVGEVMARRKGRGAPGVPRPR